MNRVLVISVGAILGANARWFISRFASRILGPVFPYGTPFLNVTGSFMVGFLHDLGQRARAARSLAGVCWW